VHLAQLHERAAELKIKRYRLLTKTELTDAIAAAESKKPSFFKRLFGFGKKKDKPKASGRDGRGKRDGRKPARSGAKGEPVEGKLDLTRRGYGFIRLQGSKPHPDDVYVSASQVKRLELKAGDRVAGPARPPEGDERYRAMVRIEKVNGKPKR
jgi:transcription termination factor Rho